MPDMTCNEFSFNENYLGAVQMLMYKEPNQQMSDSK